MTRRLIEHGWHFLREDMRLGYDDGRLVKPGKALKVDCAPVLCSEGMHWSTRAIDALRYAPGPIVCRVRSVRGHDVIRDTNKCVSTARHCIAMADATDVLWSMSRKWAASVFWQHFKREDYPDVAKWLDDGDFSARSAASSAAWSAAESAARAARSAAESAARSAAWSAARAARSAAESAAWSAARSAAWSAANDELERELFALLKLEAPCAS